MNDIYHINEEQKHKNVLSKVCEFWVYRSKDWESLNHKAMHARLFEKINDAFKSRLAEISPNATKNWVVN